MKSITRVLLLKEEHPEVYQYFVEEINSSQITSDYYQIRCDLEIGELERLDGFDLTIFEKFLLFIIESGFGIEFYNKQAERTIVCFGNFLMEQPICEVRDTFLKYSKRLRNISEKSFSRHLGIYSKILEYQEDLKD